MYKAVFIDDEPLIREGLKKYLDWSKYGFIVVGEAEDGIKGVELCKRLVPDIVITDIRMPGKDGIELIGELNCELKDTKFIILSGFAEFELAQKAIRLGACDYILKPLNKEQFINTIVKVKELLDKYWDEFNNSCRISHVVRKHSHLLKNTVIANILEGKTTDLIDQVDFFELKGSCFQILSFDFDTTINCDQTDELQKIFGAVGMFIDRNNLNWHICQYHNENLIFCCIEKLEKHEVMKEVYQLIEEINEVLGWKLFVGIGEIADNLDTVVQSYKTASENLKSRFYSNCNQVFDDRPEYIQEDLKRKYLYIENETAIFSALENGDWPKLESAYFTLIESINISGYHSPEDVKDFYGCLVSKIAVRTKNIEGNSIDIDQIMRDIHSQKSYRSLMGYVKDLLHKICISFYRGDELDSSKLIKEIKRYINDNVSNDINLNTTATRFHMNPFYVSHLFKKETNMNFLDYLTSQRIEKAKELLEDVDSKIYEIAIKVGYDDQRYFSQVFKKYTGYTPKEYRNKRS